MILVLLGCSSKKQSNNLRNDKFVFPTILQFNVAGKVDYFKEESVVEVWPKFIGQFKFSDSIYFTGEIFS